MPRRKRIAPMELEIRIPIPDDPGIQYIDLAQCLSLMNRKFIRQQHQFAVRSVELISNGSGTVTLNRLRNDWVTINALEKAFHIWRESQNAVLDNNPSIKSRYHDFKVFMDATHAAGVAAGGIEANAWPIGYMKPSQATATSATSVYDWDYSEIQMPNDPTPGVTTGYSMHVVGHDTSASKGIIAGYADSRSRPQSNDPNTVDVDGWMIQAFDDGDNLEEIRADVVENNDQPPYIVDQDTGIEFYPGGQYNYDAVASGFNFAQVDVYTTAGTALTRTPGSGSFICTAGLLQMTSTVTGQSGSNVNYLKITMEPGPNKGLMMLDMKEVN